MQMIRLLMYVSFFSIFPFSVLLKGFAVNRICAFILGLLKMQDRFQHTFVSQLLYCVESPGSFREFWPML